MLLLTAALLVAVDPALCRVTVSGRIPSGGWETDGKGNLSISLDAPATGRVSLRCRIRLPSPAEVAVIEFDHVLVSFQPSATKRTGSGLVISAGGCSASLLRVTGEDWIEASHRKWTAPVEPGTHSLELRLELIDNSDKDPIRVDLSGLRVSPGGSAGKGECSTGGSL